MSDLSRLPCRDNEGRFRIVVESPRGTLVKLKWDHELGAFVFGRPLLLGVAYPYDWGFVPSTRAPDGDPLDGMVIFECPTAPGVVIACRAIGVIRLVQKDKGKKRVHNDRIIAVPGDDPRYEDVSDLPERVRDELAQFFVTASLMSGKKVDVKGWSGAKAAERLVDETARAYERGAKKK